MQTTNSPGRVTVTTTVSPFSVCTEVLICSMGAIFWAISVQRLEQ